MTEVQSGAILQQLARLEARFEESVTSLRRDMERDGERRDKADELERQESHLSRKELHEKVNGVAEDVATVKGDVKVAGMVAAQARDAASELKATVEKAAPTLADVENAKKIGAMLLWFIGGGGVAIVAAVLAWGEAIKGWLAHWLGIK